MNKKTFGVLFLIITFSMCSGTKNNQVIQAELDQSRSFLILSTDKASQEYKDALKESLALHPEADSKTFDPHDLSTAESILKKHLPYYTQVFILPQELDVNFGWDWLTMTARLDEDPFVDTRTGFITGATPEDAADFVRRISKAVSGGLQIPLKMIDNLGPNQQAGQNFFKRFSHSVFIPVIGEKMKLESLSHGTGGISQDHLDSMKGAGLIHFGGHGHPHQIDQGMTAEQILIAELSPCVCFSGACYTGVVGTYYEMFSPQGTVMEKTVPGDDSFCLNLLKNSIIGYLASLHPDHGIPVYQEMEYMALKGASLGEVIKYTYDGVVLGNRGQLPKFEPLSQGISSPSWTPTEVMLKGTASRVLFGDPSLKLLPALAVEKPLDITIEPKQEKLIIGAIMNNPEYKSLFTDTYHDDLAFQKNMFNDRALFEVKLPPVFKSPSSVKVLGAANGPTRIKYKLRGWAVEKDRGNYFLWVQVDLASTGYMQSEWRNKGAAVGIEVIQTEADI
ncbi:MAG: hypothetical protein GF421_12910 [Candidatus Aminicenantes bacterium]|nr:hypothetical protein [Candidatus Aminicenantes bacterium]